MDLWKLLLIAKDREMLSDTCVHYKHQHQALERMDRTSLSRYDYVSLSKTVYNDKFYSYEELDRKIILREKDTGMIVRF